VARDIVKLAQAVDAKIEVNLFYRSVRRELAIKKLLEKAGANEILGFRQETSAIIPELNSERRHVDPQGILVSDVVLVPLEDGDRTEALVRMGKNVIAIDLNPLSRTAQRATITIVDNIVRAVPKLVKISEELKKQSIKSLQSILRNFDNRKILAQSITIIEENLSRIAEESGQKTQKG
jgi:4-phosphopantoate--beta-alanine ligase